MRKPEVYVETSVWGAVADEDTAYFRVAAERLLERVQDMDFYVSPVVIREINAAGHPLQKRILSTIKKVEPAVLDETPDVVALAESYIEKGLFSERYRNDALHVAFATYYAMDFLVSYNFRHMVRVTRRNIIKTTNSILGYQTPEIVSAEELAAERWEE